MNGTPTSTQRFLLLTGTLIVWFALIAQFYLIIENRIASVPETILRYFGYFTILTNLMIALCFTALLLGKSSFFHKVSTQTAIAVYILIVGLVYNFILRGITQPQGMDRLVDELLHLVLPLFYLFYWFVYGSGQALAWKQAFLWLLYPFLYILYSLLRGSFVHFYPYPFIDVDKLGYPEVLRNSLLLTFVFLAFCLLFVAITRWKNKRLPDNK